MNRRQKKLHRVRTVILVALLALLAFAALVVFFRQKAEAPELQDITTVPQTQKAKPNTKPTFDKTKYSIDTPGSIWWIVNKKRPLPAGYVPTDLVVPNVRLRLAASSEQMRISKQVVPALEQLFQAAANSSAPLILASGYRSEAYQTSLYQTYVARDGQAAADRYSAKPGTSEHQTGLAFDVCAAGSSCDLVQSFGATPQGQWLKAHAHEYGFIIHYQEGKEASTGYDYEPWHLRYVGTELANELSKTSQTLEEFFGL